MLVSAEMLRQQHKRPAFLFTGVPGIGKSIFMIYFICRYSIDDRFVDKRFAVETKSDQYCFFEPTETSGKYLFSFKDLNGFPFEEVVVFSDVKDSMEPAGVGKWLLIFSSPNPVRYKQTLRMTLSFIYYLPTWREEELRSVDPNMEKWYPRFEKCGGVIRHVFWDDSGGESPFSPENSLELTLFQKGPTVARNFFTQGFGSVDEHMSYALTHVNPLRTDDGRIKYSVPVLTFASDYVFRRIASIFQQGMLLEATAWFSAGGEIAAQKYGAATAGWMFERICLWCVPLAGREICCEPLGANLPPLDKFTLPAIQLLSPRWKEEKNLMPNLLYQPTVANMEAGDGFCVVKINGTDMLVVLQITTAASHPVKATGLLRIYEAFPQAVRSKIGRKILVFVTPMEGKLMTLQKFHTLKDDEYIRESDIPAQASEFEQWVYRYNPAVSQIKL